MKKYLSQTPEYIAWIAMIRRCNEPKWHGYSRYGGRGIKVCREWLESFDAFLSSVGEKPSPDHTLEREDNNGNYEPGNVLWATRKRQARNRSSNHKLEFNGDARSIAEWSEITGIPAKVIESRLRVCGYSVERALTQKPRAWGPGRKKQ